MRVAVAGGGIAGLTSAIALSARGFEVALFERAELLQEIGAGIQLSPNAMAVLERLGVMPDLAGRLSEPSALAIYDARNGAELASVPLGTSARERYRAPYCTMLRADLQGALIATARRQNNITIQLGAEVQDARATEGDVAFAAAGRSHRADILLAADGVRSRIRQNYLGHPGPQPFGQTAWRAIVPTGEVSEFISPEVVGLWLGAGGHLVHYPVDGGARVNIVVVAEGDLGTLPRAPFGPLARRVIDTAIDWSSTELSFVDPKRHWSEGRVALIGDAAHAMAPSVAQGGAQAIEDAWVLAATLANETTNPVRALALYETSRRPRVVRVARAAKLNLNVYGLRGVPAFARNALLRTLPTKLLISRFDWLFGWRPR